MIKNNISLILILCLATIFSACAKSDEQVINTESTKIETNVNITSDNEKIEMEKLPKVYKYDTAIKNGDIVGLHGKDYNIEKLEKFIENLQRKQKDIVRVTVYTVEGDAIVNILEYDGTNFSLTVDTTRDNFGSKKIIKYKAYEIVKESKNNGVYYIVKAEGLEKYPLIYVSTNY